ncbi:CAMK/CDPK protein kinase [Phytophthora nicotianae INRA-310]|uniref:non-specific serine/threonine protein kinase n=1 Tax=Phytophthora nicotianae (strain INRA-310) TaxID=761204 RepID=W2PFC7_PHYN3|nr:CAMK/CDPK protein kinase [Phytophthora nicotianae INRA-310]ETM99330.1 CAMK/CDPK protein kinase [Phytophthora nicotianae INRA-310]
MGCTQSIDVIRPNLFQTKLCMHHKTPVTDVYRSLGELGRGAFGVVEKVEHLKTHRHYAMKTVRFESGSKRHEFEKEMGILRVLHHPNIVRMLETFEDDHHFYIIMEFSSGGTLLDRVKTRNKEFPEDEAKDIIRNLASVIQYLHSRNICHRDLKLENILVETLDNGGHIKLCDFGASTLFKSGASMRKVLGSVVYMAPEVLEGNYKETCDMWSLGVIMYMLLSNKAPFYGHTDDELVESIFAGEVKYNGKVWDTISPEAKALLRKLLHTIPEDRFTAAQVLQHPWIRSTEQAIPPEVYDEFVPRLKAFCNYTPFQRAALVAMAFCMSSEQVALHAAVYNELNVAHNGQLKLQELCLSPALIPFQLDLEKIFAALDQQHENGINLLEFVAATISPEDAADEELLLSTFYVLDRSHRGAITKDDLKALLGQHFDVSECQEMINKADADKDGQVNYNDFVKMMKLPTLNGKTTRVSFTQRRSSARRQSGISDGSVPNAPLTDTKEDTIQPSAGPETIEVELPEVTV